MQFCKCGSIMVPEKKGTKQYMVCRKCGAKTKKKGGDYKLKEEKKDKEKIKVIENNEVSLPTTVKMCPKCEHMKCYWWLQQTRSADEPPTQFFRCVDCRHTWREYK